MRFVDEFRDADKAHALAAKIAALCEPGRQYKLMEVCGGHTHTIYKHGLEDYLPESVTAGARPRVPGVRDPDGPGRRRDPPGLAAGRDHDLVRRHDAGAGQRRSFFDANAEGTNIRMVYSPLDSLKIARQNPDKRVVFMAIGFETTAPSTAMTMLRAAAEGLTNFSVFCNHVTIIPAIKAILDSPDLRLDGFIGPGHVSTVIGCRPYEFIARDYGKPVVVAGFEPLDILQSIYMLMVQLSQGRSEVENQYSRVVPWDGNPVALKAIGETMELRPYFEWRGLGFISHSALQGPGEVRGHGRGAAVPGARGAGRRPEGLPVRRGAQGRAEAVGVQGVRHRVHAGDADRDLHGVPGGRLRGLLQLRPDEPQPGPEAQVARS
jgi:hydrogenase expression/formation protein HypD